MKFPIFIASSIEYEKIHLERIIANIIDCNIPVEYVYIISGGHPTSSSETINGINIIRVTYRCFEFTPFIYLVKNADHIDFKYAFFTHDTVSFGKKFYENIERSIDYMNENNYETKKIEASMSMNIGIYTKKCILNNSNMLLGLSLENPTTNELWNMKHRLVDLEDKILNNSIMCPCDYSNPTITQYSSDDTNGNKIDVYKKVYLDIDFIKYQTNSNTIKSISSPVNML